MSVEQLQFFPQTYEEKLEQRINDLELSLNKVRKALFARHGELAKMYLKIDSEHEAWKASLCRKHEHATN